MTLNQYYDKCVKEKTGMGWNEFCAKMPENIKQNWKLTMHRHYKILKKMTKENEENIKCQE